MPLENNLQKWLTSKNSHMCNAVYFRLLSAGPFIPAGSWLLPHAESMLLAPYRKRWRKRVKTNLKLLLLLFHDSLATESIFIRD